MNFTFFQIRRPLNISVNKNKTRKIKNKILAIEAASTAIPVNPKNAAIIAIIKKVAAQRSIVLKFKNKKSIQKNYAILH